MRSNDSRRGVRGRSRRTRRPFSSNAAARSDRYRCGQTAFFTSAPAARQQRATTSRSPHAFGSWCGRDRRDQAPDARRRRAFRIAFSAAGSGFLAASVALHVFPQQARRACPAQPPCRAAAGQRRFPGEIELPFGSAMAIEAAALPGSARGASKSLLAGCAAGGDRHEEDRQSLEAERIIIRRCVDGERCLGDMLISTEYGTLITGELPTMFGEIATGSEGSLQPASSTHPPGWETI